ncbi:MAG: type II secretion system F family protein [Acidobacteriaceae bacterium]
MALFGSKLGHQARLVLYEKLAHSLENKQSVEFALASVVKRLRKRGKTSSANKIESVLFQRMNGASFAEAIGDQLPDQEAGILAAGEIAGRLPAALRLVLGRDAQKKRVAAAITQALTPAAMNLLLLFAFLYIVGAYVMPALSAISPPSRWTGTVRVLYLAGELALGWHGPVLFGGFAAITVLVLAMLPRYRGFGRVFLERHIFPFGLYRDVVGLDWGMSLASMLSAGISDTDAISRQIEYANPWLRSRLEPIYERMRHGGETMAEALESTGLDFPSPELIQDIAGISGFSDFSERLPPMLERNSAEVEKSVKNAFFIVGMVVSLVVYTLFGLVQIASNQLGSQVSNVIH